MPSLRDCFKSALDQGQITHNEYAELERRHAQLVRAALAPSAIREQMSKEMAAEAAHRKRVKAISENKRLDLVETVTGMKDPITQLKYLVENMGQIKAQDAETKRFAILAKAHEMMSDLLHEFRKGIVTGELRRATAPVKARIENIIRELFGESTTDIKAKALADAWTKTAEMLRQRFNAAGGAIGKLEKWGAPQVHDREAMLIAGGHKGGPAAKQAWIDYIAPLLAPERMRHPLTGNPMTREDLLEALGHVYDTIVSDGWNTREPTAHGPAGALYSRHADHRFLVFKDADSWLKYQRQFGEADPFSSMMGHISTMTRDIALMEVFGTNPRAQLDYLMNLIEKMHPADPRVAKMRKDVNDMYAFVSGTANMPVGTRMANVFGITRNLISATSLGGATLASLADLGTQHAVRLFNGLPSAGMLTSILRQFTTKDTMEAVKARLVLDDAIHHMHRQARYIGTLSGRSWSAFLNDRVLAASGLLTWTQAGKHAFGMDFQAYMASLLGKKLEELPTYVRDMLVRHGFDELDGGYLTRWDRLNKALQGRSLYEPRPGVSLLRPQEIEAAVIPGDRFFSKEAMQDLSDRYMSMIFREMRGAVIESTVASKAGMLGQNQPGTFMGELVRSAGQFKSFSATFAMMHMNKVAQDLMGGNIARGAMYATTLLITTTLLGALSVQLKAIAAGKDPSRMDLTKEGAKFWGAAMLQGGGLGIYGDFLFADLNRHGGSLGATIAGPMVDRIDSILKLSVGNIAELMQGKNTHFGRELSRFINQNSPGSSLWWMKLAYGRLLNDNLQRLIDRDAHTAWATEAANEWRDYKRRYWWRRGQNGPERGPDLGRTFPSY